MIVGSYCLDLYCDGKDKYDHINIDSYMLSLGQFQTKIKTYQYARKVCGWVIKEKENLAFCPECVKEVLHKGNIKDEREK